MKYVIILLLGLRARLATASCAAEETAFNSCYTALTDGTYDENPFTYWEDDDESLSLPDCAGASATFNDRCASGPAECPAEYEAWVECGYADLAETEGLECEGFTYDCSTPQPTTAVPSAAPTSPPSLAPSPSPTLEPSPAPTRMPTREPCQGGTYSADGFAPCTECNAGSYSGNRATSCELCADPASSLGVLVLS